MTRIKHNWMILGTVFCLSVAVQADTLYLDDGSVLTGLVIQETANDCVIANARYGDLLVSRSHILYQETGVAVDTLDTFTITRDAATVIARVMHSVPVLAADTSDFKLMVPGQVKAICDSNGLEIPMTPRLIGSNTLVTMKTLDLAPDTTSLIATSLQDGMIQPTPSGHLAFSAHYIPDHAKTIRVVLKYPKTFKLQSITPEPQLQLDGLIVWEQTLNRQQQFAPILVFTP
ncbi:MAG: hypothetical protein HQ515_26960 [Phycisphaeraceae bacterium]|nr:hypothetical protein [Phycisphaeraceae bacterium]